MFSNDEIKQLIGKGEVQKLEVGDKVMIKHREDCERIHEHPNYAFHMMEYGGVVGIVKDVRPNEQFPDLQNVTVKNGSYYTWRNDWLEKL